MILHRTNDKAFQISLNTSYSKTVKGNEDYFISSISDALAQVFPTPPLQALLVTSPKRPFRHVIRVYNSTWPVSNQSIYLGTDYTVVELSVSVAARFSGKHSRNHLESWWNNLLKYWTTTKCGATCSDDVESYLTVCTCATLPTTFWLSNHWFMKDWHSPAAAALSVKSMSLYGERINEPRPPPPPARRRGSDSLIL